MKARTTPPALVANPERGEVLLTLAGVPRRIRFGLLFLKALTESMGEAGPTAALAALETAPVSALIDFAVLGIKVCVPAGELPADFDALVAVDELAPEEQTELLRVMLKSITASPLLAALRQTKAA